jgi:omega-amidase
MKIALVQLNSQWESKKANFKKAEDYIKEASGDDCDIIVFPEMFATGFSMNIAALAEEKNGETQSFLSTMAHSHNINIIAGLALKNKGDEKARNTAAVYNRTGDTIATYTKIHPFTFTGENKFYSAGNRVVTFELDGVPSSVFICYDLRFPEIFRLAAKDVAAIFVPANWPASRKEHWESLLKARAIENQCFVIGVNRTGIDGNGIEYPGASHVFDPLGKNLCSGTDCEEMILCQFDPEKTFAVRKKFPFLNDMRHLDIDLGR